MLYAGTMAASKPPKVSLELDSSGRRIVRLTDHAKRFESEEGSGYIYDEVTFPLPADRAGETVATIKADFAAWWAYGAQPEEPAPTIEERLADLEEAVLAMMGGEEL